MTLFKRPNADYQPDKILPNYDVFQRLAGEKKPLPSRLLDALANYLIDGLNALSDALDKAKAGVFPGSDDPANKDKIIYSDGTTGKWGKIVGLFMAPLTVTAREIGDKEVKKGKIDVGAVGTEEVENESITDPKIKSVSLPKIRSSGNAALVVGQKGGSHYGELSYLGTPKLALPAVGDDGILKLYNLTSIWYYADGQYEGSKLRDHSTPLSKLDSGTKTASVLGSGIGNTDVVPILAPNDTYSILSGGGGNDVGFRGIANVLENAPRNQTKGTLIEDDTLPYSKIKASTNPLSNIKFFDAGYYSNNSSGDFYLFKSFKAVKTSKGLYDFTILTNYRTNYFLVSVTFSGESFPYFVTQTTAYSFRLTVTKGEAPFAITIIGYEDQKK